MISIIHIQMSRKSFMLVPPCKILGQPYLSRIVHPIYGHVPLAPVSIPTFAVLLLHLCASSACSQQLLRTPCINSPLRSCVLHTGQIIPNQYGLSRSSCCIFSNGVTVWAPVINECLWVFRRLYCVVAVPVNQFLV